MYPSNAALLVLFTPYARTVFSDPLPILGPPVELSVSCSHLQRRLYLGLNRSALASAACLFGCAPEMPAPSWLVLLTVPSICSSLAFWRSKASGGILPTLRCGQHQLGDEAKGVANPFRQIVCLKKTNAAACRPQVHPLYLLQLEQHLQHHLHPRLL